MQFGPEVNASTSFDETVYKITVPTDNTKTMRTAFEILSDWAHNLNLTPAEIDKERGVVIEEWRLGRGAEARMRDEYFPVLFKDSRYAERLPIGNDPQLLRTFPYDTIKRFYRDWYRPDLMGVIAIGDFKGEDIEALIRRNFGGLQNPANERVRKLFTVAPQSGTTYDVVTDPEATYTSVDVFYKYDPEKEVTVRDYRKTIIENLYNYMLNQRLDELTQQAQPPYLGAQSYNYRILKTKSVYDLIAIVRDGGALKGLETILTEAARVERHGFTPGELDRAKKELMSSMEAAYRERNTTESVRYAEEYVRNFTKDEPIPGIEYEYELYRNLLPGISVENVNALAEEWIKDDDRVVLVKAPEKEGVPVPTESELSSVIRKVAAAEIAPYEDTSVDQPLVDREPVPGTVTKEKSLPAVGAVEWTLSNGMKVILKATNFKNDEVLFTSYSPGGSSVVPDDSYMSAIAATSIISMSGVGDFSMTQLQKKLAGKSVSVSPYIGEVTEGLSGRTRPDDLETAFKLMYLYFTAPREDETAFKSFMDRMTGYVQNRQSQPEAQFQDMIQTTMSQNAFRERPLTLETLSEIDMKKAFQVYRDRFSDAGDFTFVFVGSFNLEEIRPLVLRYLGGLPATGRNETWKDNGIDPPKGIVTKTVEKGLEPKGLVSITYSGDYAWTRENNYLLDSLQKVLDIRLREAVREDASGTYGVQVEANVSHYPDQEYNVQILFSCDPERVDELTQIVFREIEKLQNTPPEDIYITKVRETQKRSFEQNLQDNTFWMNAIEAAYLNGLDPSLILQYNKLVDSLNAQDIQRAAAAALNMKNYVKIVLYPENMQEGNGTQN